MILQALKEYCDRQAANPESGIAPFGWEWKEIPYLIVLNNDGVPTNIETTVEGSGKKKTTKKFLVPQTVVRSVGVVANCLWDMVEYTVGAVVKGKPERVAQQHQAFKDKITALGEINDAGFQALKKFLELSNKEELLGKFAEWQTLKEKGLFHTFRLAGAAGILSDSPAVKQVIDAANTAPIDDESDASPIVCLVSGENDNVKITHDKIKGVWGCQSTGGSIVSVNFAAAESYGKKQGAVSPIGKRAAFAFATAVNTMLAKDSKNRLQVGDASTIFWASRQTDFENNFLAMFSEPPKDDPDAGISAVRSLYQSLNNGAYQEEGNKTEFYVLGLAPNAGRISVRFWIVATVAEMAARIRQHFEDLKISRRTAGKSPEPEYLSIFRLLISVATQGKSENIPPNLSDGVMRAILEGLPYPTTLFNAVLRRIRAEHEVTYPRAAIIKAYLNRLKQPNEEDIKPMLDLANKNCGYRLGRLFAVLEKIQEEANPGINATIRDRFYGAASGTPASVFPNLMRLKNHHLSKLEHAGRKVNLERLLGEIIGGITAEFPAFLDMPDQGRFAVGYYHQRQDFFTKKDGANQD